MMLGITVFWIVVGYTKSGKDRAEALLTIRGKCLGD